MIGVVIPAHNEAELIGACMRAVTAAAAHSELDGEAVEIVVVLDHCSDATARVVAGYERVRRIEVELRNVGQARAAGAELMLALGARWLAFTDADTEVSPRWLVHQLFLQADVVCGSVGVDDWTPHGADAEYLRERFAATYTDADGHSHIHGANLGVSAEAYRRTGGFEALACSEDVALVRALQAAGARIAWSALPRVATSSRRHARVQGGFGDALMSHIRTRELLSGPPPDLATG